MAFFPFCDLPKEIQILIYEECFGCIYIYIDDSPSPFNTIYDDGSSFLNRTPAFLLVSKFIREESLAIFYRSVYFVRVASDYKLSLVPPAYLTNVKEIYLTHPNISLFDKHTFPRLQLLRVSIRPYEFFIQGSTEMGQGGKKKLCLHDSQRRCNGL